MTFSVVQTAVSSVVTSGSSIPVTLGSPSTAGNRLVIAGCAVGSSLCSIQSVTLGGSSAGGSTQIGPGGSQGGGLFVITTLWLTSTIAGGQTAVVANVGPNNVSSFGCAIVYEVSGWGSAAFDQFSNNSGTGSTSTFNSGNTPTTTHASEIWFGLCGVGGASGNTLTGPVSPWNNTTTFTGGGGSGTTGYFVAGYQIVTSTGIANYTSTSSPGNLTGACGIATFGAFPQATAYPLQHPVQARRPLPARGRQTGISTGIRHQTGPPVRALQHPVAATRPLPARGRMQTTLAYATPLAPPPPKWPYRAQLAPAPRWTSTSQPGRWTAQLLETE